MERSRREKVRRVKWGRILVGLIVVIGVASSVVFGVPILLGESGGAVSEGATEVREPEVPIVDENAGEAVSERVKEYVVRLTDDVAYEGYRVARVVLPFQKTREIDVYLLGRVEYYKVSVDRGSAVSAEDMGRMARHLDKNGLKPGYVDIRVEGKAYFK